MRYLLIILVVLVGQIAGLLTPTLMAQCITGPVEKTVKVGSTVTVSWTMPSPLPEGLLYYRIRRAAHPAGSYSPWVKVPADKLEYSFVVTEAKSYIYFIGVWYSMIENGQSVIRESVGSNQVRITGIP